jgi:hypothetical protein
MYPGILFIDLDSVKLAPADLKALAASGHDIVLLSDQDDGGAIRRGLSLSADRAITYTVITKPAIQALNGQWKAISIYAIARLMNAVKLFLIGEIDAPTSQYYTTEHYRNLSGAIGGIR